MQGLDHLPDAGADCSVNRVGLSIPVPAPVDLRSNVDAVDAVKAHFPSMQEWMGEGEVEFKDLGIEPYSAQRGRAAFKPFDRHDIKDIAEKTPVDLGFGDGVTVQDHRLDWQPAAAGVCPGHDDAGLRSVSSKSNPRSS